MCSSYDIIRLHLNAVFPMKNISKEQNAKKNHFMANFMAFPNLKESDREMHIKTCALTKNNVK